MKIKAIIVATGLALASAYTSAATITVQIQNLTHASYFTPLAVVAHDADNHLFQVGQVASEGIIEMAEGGGLTGLTATAEAIGAQAEVAVVENANGFLSPGLYGTVTDLEAADSNTQLSITGMVLPSNDGFVGLDSWTIPEAAGTYTIYLNAYDAGSEANNELLVGMPAGASGVAGIPGNPGGVASGTGGTGAVGEAEADDNTTVHIHRGVLGDTDSEGGVSDLDSRVHRWLNPVAKVVVTVQ